MRYRGGEILAFGFWADARAFASCEISFACKSSLEHGAHVRNVTEDGIFRRNFLYQQLLNHYICTTIRLIHTIVRMESKSRDILLDDKYKVHISIVPKLGLVIVNELEDFGENWMEVNVTQASKSRSSFDIRTLAGDPERQPACRYLIESLHKGLQTNTHMPEQISLIFKFIINFSLRAELCSSHLHLSSLAQALVEILQDFRQSQSSHPLQEFCHIER